MKEDSKADMLITFQDPRTNLNLSGNNNAFANSNRTSVSHTPALSTGHIDALEKQRLQLRLLTQFQRTNQLPLNVHCYPYHYNPNELQEPEQKSFE